MRDTRNYTEKLKECGTLEALLINAFFITAIKIIPVVVEAFGGTSKKLFQIVPKTEQVRKRM